MIRKLGLRVMREWPHNDLEWADVLGWAISAAITAAALCFLCVVVGVDLW